MDLKSKILREVVVCPRGPKAVLFRLAKFLSENLTAATLDVDGTAIFFFIINFKISLKVPISNWNGMGVIRNVVRKKEVGLRDEEQNSKLVEL